jgi:hypothetical protein
MMMGCASRGGNERRGDNRDTKGCAVFRMRGGSLYDGVVVRPTVSSTGSRIEYVPTRALSLAHPFDALE